MDYNPLNELRPLIKEAGGIDHIIVFGQGITCFNLTESEAISLLDEIETNVRKDDFFFIGITIGGIKYIVNRYAVRSQRQAALEEAGDLDETSYGTIEVVFKEDYSEETLFYPYEGEEQATAIIEEVFDFYGEKVIEAINIDDRSDLY